MFVASKLLEEVLLRELGTIFLLGTEIRRDIKHWHNGVRINTIRLNLFGDLHCVGKSFRNIGEDIPHLLGRLQPLLFSIVHS